MNEYTRNVGICIVYDCITCLPADVTSYKRKVTAWFKCVLAISVLLYLWF